MTQYARPDTDIDAGNWYPQGGPSTLYECMDEVTPNGTDYAEVDGGSTGTMKVELSSVTDPLSSANHTVSWTWMSTGGAGKEYASVYLYETTTLKATCASVLQVDRGGFVLKQYTLSSGEADSISDYSALRLWFTPDTLGSGEKIRVDQCELAVPDASSIYYQSVPATAGSTAGVSKGLDLHRSIPATAGSTASIGRVGDYFRSIIATAGSSAVVTKALDITKAIAAAAGSNAVLTKVLDITKAMAATAGSTATVGKVVSFFRTVAATAGSTASIAAAKIFYKILAATAGSTASFLRAIGKSIAATAVSSPVVTRGLSLHRTIAATSVGNAVLGTLSKFKQTLDAIVTGAGTLGTGALFKRILNVVESVVPSLNAAKLGGTIYYKTLAVTSNGVAVLSKLLFPAYVLNMVIETLTHLAQRLTGVDGFRMETKPIRFFSVKIDYE